MTDLFDHRQVRLGQLRRAMLLQGRAPLIQRNRLLQRHFAPLQRAHHLLDVARAYPADAYPEVVLVIDTASLIGSFGGRARGRRREVRVAGRACV